MSYRRGPAYRVEEDELYRRFRDVETLADEPSGDWPLAPINRELLDALKRIRSLELKYYAVLAAIASVTVLSALLRLGVSP